MDNASKALIMAGAILISVAIVGIGIYIFSTANSLTDDAVGQIDSLAVSAINSRIENYAGSNVRGSTVKQLAREITNLNNQGALPNNVTIPDVTSVKDSGRYNVTVQYDQNTGYVNGFSFTDASSAAGGGD